MRPHPRREGSCWRRWDLHVHTPASIKSNYPGSDPWPAYLDDLEALPADFAVLGINDYFSLDGYRRLVEERKAGRLQNIQALFPVVEMRIDRFAGQDSEFARINFHVIFDPALATDEIQSRFIDQLTVLCEVSPTETWESGLTTDELAQFGAALRAASPADLPKGDAHLGFSNVALDLGEIQKLLQKRPFPGHILTAVGKAEWSKMRWKGQSVAVKKSTINAAEIVFTAAENPEAFESSRCSLGDQGVNAKLLDCSDAHALSDSGLKDRVGNCATWLCAEPTFLGLQHALAEYETRVDVSDRPEKLSAVQRQGHNYIRRVTVRPRANAGAHLPQFDVDVHLTTGFGAVIGNKGRGKSALLDVIGLVGNSRNEDSFSFLRAARFRNPKENHAVRFEAELEWWDGSRTTRGLGESCKDDEAERVTYVPQSLLEDICNPDVAGGSERFEAAIGEVLFAHVGQADRLGEVNLQALIRAQTGIRQEKVADLQKQIHALNEEIAAAERASSPKAGAEIASAITDIEKRVAAHRALEVPVPAAPEPTSDPVLREAAAGVDGQRRELQRLAESIRQNTERDAVLAREINELDQIVTALETLEEQFGGFRARHDARARELGLDLAEVVRFEIAWDAVRRVKSERVAERDRLRLSLSLDGDGVASAHAEAEKKLRRMEAELSRPQREYGLHLEKRREWESALAVLLEGDGQTTGLRALRAQENAYKAIPKEIEALRSQRVELVRATFDAVLEIVAVYRELFAPARDFIEHDPIAADCGLSFTADLQEEGFETRFWEMVARNIGGALFGVEKAGGALQELLARTDFTAVDDVLAFTEAVDSLLADGAAARAGDKDSIVRTGFAIVDIYDWVFQLSYLKPRYSLRYLGKPLEQLSPGERGTLLLVFYLLVDPRETPLLLDQPDENLDNHTIKTVLVPAVQSAARRRQLLIVTHNPNVAVVADADQLIRASFDLGRFAYETGAIESVQLNRAAVDVLEGTWPAFDNRRAKYQRPAPSWVST